ncbi:MAG: IS30 family transposase [bacterium]
MSHHHLSRGERVALAAFLRTGKSRAECARLLGVHRSTISRELRRGGTEYKAVAADKEAARLRRESKQRARKIENDHSLEREIVRLLKKGHSPEQVSEEVRFVSDDAIYDWIERSRKDLAVLLPQRGKVRRRYGKNTGAVQGWTKSVRSIAERPKAANDRSRIGDWEGDTVAGRDRARLLVHVDRKSRFILATITANGTADTIHAAAGASFKGLPVRTITYDRGSEFALWRMIERDTGATVYFANAHHPWERGTSENSNGLLRRFFPKGTPIGEKLQRDVDRAVRLINHRPRKCLGWKTPCRVFGRCCVSG